MCSPSGCPETRHIKVVPVLSFVSSKFELPVFFVQLIEINIMESIGSINNTTIKGKHIDMSSL